ncbi:MAG TPA: hypothetical protein PKH39_04985 [Woeseiaceae bacterium]|nr:hypothetical protein [Woeseiaceae bacterium]
MRICGIILLALTWEPLFAELADYETTIELDSGSVGSVLADIEAKLGIMLRSEEIASAAGSIGPGFVFQQDFDLSHGGITFEATYQVARLESGLVSISFSAHQRRTIEAICRESLSASSDGKEDQSAKACDFSKPETFRI